MSDQMSNLLSLIAPNTVGAGGNPLKGGQTADGKPASPTSMPISNPNAWAKMGAGNFMPSGGAGKGGQKPPRATDQNGDPMGGGS